MRSHFELGRKDVQSINSNLSTSGKRMRTFYNGLINIWCLRGFKVCILVCAFIKVYLDTANLRKATVSICICIDL